MEKILIKNADDVLDNFNDFISGKKKGVIKLCIPVLNVTEWYGKRQVLSLASGIPEEDLEQVAYYVAGVDEDGNVVSIPESGAVMGAEGIKRLLGKVDFKARFTALRQQEIELMQEREKLWEDHENSQEESCDAEEPEIVEGPLETEDTPFEKALKKNRYALEKVRYSMDAIRYFTSRQENFFITEIKAFPVQMRPMIENAWKDLWYGIEDIRASLSLIASRNHRIERLMEMQAPEIIMRNESRMLQEHVDRYLDNGRHGRPAGEQDPDTGIIRSHVSLADIVMYETRMI